MKQSDKFLVAIVLVILGLVIATFVMVLIRPEPQYRPDDSAEAAVFNYILALQKEDYDRALSYLSKDVNDRPTDAADMEWDVKQNLWQFDQYEQPVITIVRSRISSDSATVTIKKTWSEDPLLGSARSSEFTMRLQLEADRWQLVDGQTHWVDDWREDHD